MSTDERSQASIDETGKGTISPSAFGTNFDQMEAVARVRSAPRSEWVDALREFQRRQWLEGRPIPAESIILLFPELNAEETLVLIGGEYSLRRQQGRPANPTEFQQRFPQHAEQLGVILSLLDQSSEPQSSATGHATNDISPVPSAAPESIERPLPVIDPQAGAEPIPGFKLVRMLGMGGFGSVWLAEAPGQFPVALKFVVLSGQVGASELRSLEVLRHLRHSNLLSTFGAWKNERYLIIAMELADRTLADRYREAKDQGLPGIPRDELHEYMQDAAKGIDYLNEPHVLIEGQAPLRVQHRDIKPANILLVGNGVKVADFGLARVLEKNLVSHTGGLTPAYGAPEFFQGKTSRHSDQYSLATAYCELRGGRLPFTGALADLIMGHVEQEPDLSMLPVEERPAVARALAKNPDARWPSCKTFVEALGHQGSGTLMDAIAVTQSITGEKLHANFAETTAMIPFAQVEKSSYRRLFIGLAAVIAIATATIAGRWDSIRESWKPALIESSSQVADRGTPVATVPQTIPDTRNVPEKSVAKPSELPTFKPDTESPPAKEMKLAPPKEPEQTPLPRLAVGERLRFVQHAPAVVRCAAGVPNTSQIVSGDEEGNLRLWDSATGKQLQQLPGHTKGVQCLTVSPDGRFVLSGGDDTVVRLLDLESPKDGKVLKKKRLTEKDPDFEIYGIGFLDKQRAISGGSANQIIEWDLEEAKESGRLETSLDEVLCLTLEPGGKHALIGGTKGALRLRTTSVKNDDVSYNAHLDDVLSVAFFADGKHFVSAGGGDGREKGHGDFAVRIWKVAEKEPCTVFKSHRAPVGCVAVSPDGSRILSGDLAGNLYLWDAETGIAFPRFDQPKEGDAPRGGVTCVLFSADGKEAITGHGDGILRVWVLPK